MIRVFRKLFNKEKDTIKALLDAGATVVDVRSEREYESDHMPGSINIPLSELDKNIDLLRSKQPLIVCCASGMRSAAAAKELHSRGLMDVHNGGSWQKVDIQKNRR